jgi:predicted nuclease of restriction endonuclease-like (RecB) superfamily
MCCARRLDLPDRELFGDVSGLIESAKRRVAASVNSELVMLYWSIGKRIREDVLGRERAEYGKRVVAELAEKLTVKFGRGYGRINLTYMVRVAELWPDPPIVQSLSEQLSWTHLVRLIAVEDALEREFYTLMASTERWSVRTLREQIARGLYLRSVATRKPLNSLEAELATLRETGRSTPDLALRDPYVLDFLGLPSEHTEADLESAILEKLERFLTELGGDFAFVARQKRIVVDGDDYHLDLLFFHRGLRRLVAIELKAGKLRPEHKGQMELYLRWLDRYERQLDEEPPLGLILCSEKGPQQVELLELDHGDIRAARYLLEKLPIGQLERCVEEASLDAPED